MESRVFDDALLQLGHDSRSAHVLARTHDAPPPTPVDDFGDAISQVRESLDACVVVGGFLLWANHGNLADAARRGIRIRLLFPYPQSDWLAPMVAAAGADRTEYATRITGNAARAQALGPGVDIQWYTAPTTVWFAMFDKRAVAHKEISFASKVTPTITTDGQAIRFYRRLFDALWLSASRT
jgi:hypothetical protein